MERNYYNKSIINNISILKIPVLKDCVSNSLKNHQNFPLKK